MSEGEEPGRRWTRMATEFDVVLSEPGGAVIDGHAQARELSVAGFRAETQVALNDGQSVAFEVVLPDGDKVAGRGRVVWTSHDQFGWFVSGVKITRLSWKDRGRLRRAIYRPGYDFWGLARKMFWGTYLVIVVAAVQYVLQTQTTALGVALKLGPVLLALAVMGWSLMVLLT
jgi:hypothetical protein